MDITYEKLEEMIAEHKLWLDSNGERGTKFEFHGDLSGVDLSNTNLQYADLSGANMSCARILRSNFSCVDLRDANLTATNLHSIRLTRALMNGTKLLDSFMYSVDLTDAVGLISTEEYLDKTFEKTEHGYVVYKIFGMYYTPNPKWVIKPGSIIEELQCNMDRRIACGSGINVATEDWAIANRMSIDGFYIKPIWKCIIRHEWLDGVCVPYATDENIRCKKLELIKPVEY